MHTSVNFSFSTYIFAADTTPEMQKLCRVTNEVKVFFLVLVDVFNFMLTYLNFRPPFWRRVYFSKIYT